MPISVPSRPGPIRVAWELASTELAWMTKSERNSLFRESLTQAGKTYQAMFVPKRFDGKYITRPGFPRTGVGAVSKALASIGSTTTGRDLIGVGGRGDLSAQVRGFFAAEFSGWNPWEADGPPVELILAARQRRPGQPDDRAELRRWAKQRAVAEFKKIEAAGGMLPLVLTGDLRKTAPTGTVKATVTATKFTLRIPIPFPGPRSPNVSKIITTTPQNEVDFIAREFTKNIETRLTGRASPFPAQSRKMVT